MYKEIDGARYYEADYSKKGVNWEELHAFAATLLIIIALVVVWAITHN